MAVARLRHQIWHKRSQPAQSTCQNTQTATKQAPHTSNERPRTVLTHAGKQAETQPNQQNRLSPGPQTLHAIKPGTKMTSSSDGNQK